MNNELYHHGIKGQRWGVRKLRPKLAYKYRTFRASVPGRLADKRELNNRGKLLTKFYRNRENYHLHKAAHHQQTMGMMDELMPLLNSSVSKLTTKNVESGLTYLSSNGEFLNELYIKFN